MLEASTVQRFKERRKDGSRASVETECKKRGIACKQTGAHIQTDVVSKKRKVYMHI